MSKCLEFANLKGFMQSPDDLPYLLWYQYQSGLAVFSGLEKSLRASTIMMNVKITNESIADLCNMISLTE